jgi:hypothetical protein
VVTERIRSVRDLVVYKKAFEAAMKIFEISRGFPNFAIVTLRKEIIQSRYI